MDETLLCVGVMSGSSLDGIDLALVAFSGRDDVPFTWNVLALQQKDIPKNIRKKLSLSDTLSSSDLFALDAEFGRMAGQAIGEWCAGLNVKPHIVAVHGHTVFHEPESSFSVQLGSGAHIAHECGFSVLTGIRSMDMAAGGRGAPYAPLADRALFAGYDAWINLGGIANMSAEVNGRLTACDVVIGNQLLNMLAERKNQRFDENGTMASTGKVIRPLLDELRQLYPAMDRVEAMSNQWVRQKLAAPFLSRNEPPEDLLATAVEWIAESLVRQLHSRFAGTDTDIKVLLSGGGAHNKYLVDRMQTLAGNRIALIVPENEVIDFKEAMLMSYLGYLYLTQTPAPLAQTTGASKDHIQGSLWKIAG